MSPPRRWEALAAVAVALPSSAWAASSASASSSSSSSAGSHSGSASASSSTASSAPNTLTTSCNGGCSVNGACVVVGQSPTNPINCVNNTDCATLSSGQAALCMDAFDSDEADWVFRPGDANDSLGVAPFERIGLLQLDDQVTQLEFRRANEKQEPLSTALQLSSMNIQPDATLNKVSFYNLSLSGASSALALNSVTAISINNCSLSAIPTQLVSGDSVASLNLQNNSISRIATDFQSQPFPTLVSIDLSNNKLEDFDLDPDNFPKLLTLYLEGNALTSVPSVVFNLSTLQFLTLANNPINASSLTSAELAFLADLRLFTIDGVTNTSACPSESVQSALNGSFTFCVEQDGNDTVGSLDDNNTVVTAIPTPTPTATTTSEASSSTSSWVIVGGCAAAVVVLLVVVLLYCRKRRQREPPKLSNSMMPSIAIGMGDMADHPYMDMGDRSGSSHTTSDFELLASVADGYIGLTRLSYDDVLLTKMLRVSSRSELWLGRYRHETVLVKKIKSSAASRALLRDFVTEIEHMFTLQHPRIAAFRGAMWDSEGSELCAVVEYVDQGALRDCIQSAAVDLTVPKQHAIARQIAEAVAFLHKKSIVHGRLNSFNVLLDRAFSAKLSLFAIFHYVKVSPLDAQCRAFVAPEVLRGDQPTDKADVFAFGVVLVELDTGEPPSVNARRLARESLAHGRESLVVSPTAKKTGFTLSRHCSGVMKDSIAACLERDPNRRPSMAEVVFALKTGAMTL